jgi:hypothetical protein
MEKIPKASVRSKTFHIDEKPTILKIKLIQINPKLKPQK